jgi:hypothetical protein
VAKKAAKRMVHGDVDPWRKKCESYGFLLAKSMIMMNAELHRERMKPKNIYKNIGRDHWDYSNDRVIGTGKSWNYNVINAQLHQPRVQSVGRSPGEDDSLMRVTEKTFARDTFGSIPQNVQSELTEANVVSYADYSNLEVLQKEFIFWKDLLDKAIGNIDDDYVNSLRVHRDAPESDIKTASVFLRLMWMLNGNDGEHSLNNWDEISGHFDESLQQQISQVPTNIEERKFDKEEVDKLREDFKMKAKEEDKGIMENIKEFLWESFCLIEIVEEINELKEKLNKMVI